MKVISCFFPLLFLIPSCKKDSPIQPPPYEGITACDSIYCAGTSLTAILGTDYTAYPEYLAKMLNKDQGTVYNGGHGGWISTWIADEYLSRNIVLNGAVIIEEGANDSWHRDQVKANILRTIGNNKKYLVLDILAGNLPDRWPEDPWGYYANVESLNDELEVMVGPDHFVRIKDYLQKHMDGSRQDSIDVFEHDCEPTSLHSDFIHRNSLGNYWMAKCISERLVGCEVKTILN